MKYRQWLDEWLSVNVKPRVKKSTYQKYDFIIAKQICPKLGEYELEELSAIILQKFTADLSRRYSPNTTNGIVAVLRNSLRRAQKSGIVAYQFAETLELPRVREKKIDCFSQAEQKRIEQYILRGRRYGKLFGILLCFYTGLRVGELLALEWNDIDFLRATLSVNKSCRDRWVDGAYFKELDTPKTETSERLIPFRSSWFPF